MCMLIVLRGVDPDYPIVVASNRDERLDRKSAPPGLWAGERRRVLSPRDRSAGGTWMGVNDRGMFAALTNVAAVPPAEGARTRGDLPHLALDVTSLSAAITAVQDAVAENRFGGFQLVVTDGEQGAILSFDGRELSVVDAPKVSVITNEHGVGELRLPDLGGCLEPGLSTEVRLDRLAELLLDRGDRSGHAVLKSDDAAYGTVSSSLLAVRPGDTRALIWRYASGAPSDKEYRNYGNLSRRLLEVS